MLFMDLLGERRQHQKLHGCFPDQIILTSSSRIPCPPTRIIPSQSGTKVGSQRLLSASRFTFAPRTPTRSTSISHSVRSIWHSDSYRGVQCFGYTPRQSRSRDL